MEVGRADRAIRSHPAPLRRDRPALAVKAHRGGAPALPGRGRRPLAADQIIPARGLWPGGDPRVPGRSRFSLTTGDGLQCKVLDRLETIAARLGSVEEVSTGELIETITEVIDMSERLEKYYTREQLEELEGRRRARRGESPPGRSGVAGANRAGPRRGGGGHRPGERVGAATCEALDGAGRGVHRRQPRDRTPGRQDVAVRREHPRYGDATDAGADAVRLQGNRAVGVTVETAPRAAVRGRLGRSGGYRSRDHELLAVPDKGFSPARC